MSTKNRSSRRLQTSTQPKVQEEQAWPVYSFLFVVDYVRVNEDPENGGVAPSEDPDGNWSPPDRQAGFRRKSLGIRMYRWSNGVISVAEEYTRDGETWIDANRNQVELHKCRTLFYANNFHHFRVAEGDTTSYDMDVAAFPYNRWYPLTFDNNEQALSSVNISAESNTLAGSAGIPPNFVHQLGLQGYANNEEPQVPVTSGLAGCLAILVGLVAFSCGHSDLNRVLLHDRAWREYRWRNHIRDHGRRSGRGRVISVYYDPANSEFSNSTILDGLEYGSEALIK